MIVLGDFNLTPQEMEDHEHPAFETLGRYYKSEEAHTTRSRTNSQELREIDHIFSTTPLTRSNLSHEKTAEFLQYSDHFPLLYFVEGYTAPVYSRIPSKAFAGKLLRNLLRMEANAVTESTLREHFEELQRKGVRPSKEVQHRRNFCQAITEEECNRLTGTNFIAEFEGLVDRINGLRFSASAKEGFDLIRRVTQYHCFEKRDGGLVSKAYSNG